MSSKPCSPGSRLVGTDRKYVKTAADFKLQRKTEDETRWLSWREKDQRKLNSITDDANEAAAAAVGQREAK